MPRPRPHSANLSRRIQAFLEDLDVLTQAIHDDLDATTCERHELRVKVLVACRLADAAGDAGRLAWPLFKQAQGVVSLVEAALCFVAEKGLRRDVERAAGLVRA